MVHLGGATVGRERGRKKMKILRLEAVSVELAKLPRTKPNTDQANFGSSDIANFGSSNVASFGSSDVANFGSSNVESFGSSDVASFGSSDVASFGSSYVASFGSSDVASFGSNEKCKIFKTVMQVVNQEQGCMFFLHGYGGTGKTHMWRTLTYALRSQKQIVLIVASSGIALLLLPGGRTTHSKFKIPLPSLENSICSIHQGSELAGLLKQTKLIIWDEAPMSHKFCFEALDKSLGDIMSTTTNDSLIFAGKVVVFGGDFRQILLELPLSMFATSLEPKLATSLEPKLATSHEPKLATTLEQKLATSHEPKLATSLEPKLATSLEPKLATSLEPKLATSLEPKLATSLEPKLATSLESKLATSLEPKSLTNHGWLKTSFLFIDTPSIH
ncbi:hypothetical protein Lal_00035476 [Lupinus albus]|nr:hypothetical protein Lal_00035476 [Lupinus albus]